MSDSFSDCFTDGRPQSLPIWLPTAKIVSEKDGAYEIYA